MRIEEVGRNNFIIEGTRDELDALRDALVGALTARLGEFHSCRTRRQTQCRGLNNLPYQLDVEVVETARDTRNGQG